jgi:hypothetical protein
MPPILAQQFLNEMVFEKVNEEWSVKFSSFRIRSYSMPKSQNIREISK